MKANVRDLRKVDHEPIIPDGRYPGVWGGYMVRFVVGGEIFEGMTSRGTKEPNMDCFVVVSGDVVEVETR